MRSEHRGSDVDPRGVGVRQSRCLGDFVVVGLEFGVFHHEKLRAKRDVSDDCDGGAMCLTRYRSISSSLDSVAGAIFW